jgi:hypothetical protein
VPRPRRPARGRQDKLDRLFAGLGDFERKALVNGRGCFGPGSQIVSRNRNCPRDPSPDCVGRREYVAWLSQRNGAYH